MTVVYRVEPTGRTPHEVRERLLTAACPSCGADWTARGNGLPRPPSRSFLCTTCGGIFEAHEVDESGRPVASPGWGLTQQLRTQQNAPAALGRVTGRATLGLAGLLLVAGCGRSPASTGA